MKTRALLLLLLFISSCASKEEQVSVTMPQSEKLLTIAELKYPLIDEDNGELFFPVSSDTAILKNHIRCRSTVPGIEPLNTYPSGIIDNYRRSPGYLKVSFAQWDANEFNNENNYDLEGKLIHYRESAFMPVHWRFRYDSNGYKNSKCGGSCVYINLISNYFFNENERCLVEVIDDDREYYNVTLISPLITYLSDLIIPEDGKFYYFDSLGYLQRMVWAKHYFSDSVIGNEDVYQFVYKQPHLIDSIIHDHYISAKSKHLFEIDHAEGIADRSLTRYFYTDTQLDSVTTYYEFHKEPKLNYFRRTYYDKRGLAARTTFENHLSKFWSKTVVYKYQQFPLFTFIPMTDP